MATQPLKVFLDTHAVIFLWEGRIEIFASASRLLLEKAVLFYSPMVRLELFFLQEIGRLKVSPDEILGTLGTELGVSGTQDPIAQVVQSSLNLIWTRDPFDRMIVATA